MEPTAEQRQDFEKILDSVTKKIRSYVGTAHSFRDEEIRIESISDFVLGMVYQKFFEKCVEYNLKYVKEHADTTTETNFMDMARIVIDVFQTEAKSVQELIETELAKN